MAQHKLGAVWLFSVLTLKVGLLNIGNVQAQVLPDQTLGVDQSQVTLISPQLDLIGGGARRGANLFHSFQQFNIGEGHSVYFANPQGIETIFSRVTGREASQLFGTLGVAGNANLFFLNPNGIMFGPNAQLDISGSFSASTADRFVFGDGLVFSASNPQVPPLLTVNLPIGLQPGGNPTAVIQSSGTLIAGQDLTLSAGLLNLTGQFVAGRDLTLQAQEAVVIRDTIEAPLIAAARRDLLVQGNQAIDIFTLNHPESGFFSGGNLVLGVANPMISDTQYSGINIRGLYGEGRRVSIHSRGHILLENSTVNTSFIADNNGGNIDLSAGRTIELNNTNIFSAGLIGGSTTINSGGNFLATDSFIATSTILNNQNSISGKVILDSKGSISIKNSTIDASSIFGGNGGDVTMLAKDNISLNNTNIFSNGSLGGTLMISSKGEFSATDSIIANSTATNNPDTISGSIDIMADSLFFGDGSSIFSSNFGSANVPLIKITSNETTTFTGENTNSLPSRVYSSTGPESIGSTQGIEINAKVLNLNSGARISSFTRGEGNAGLIAINTDNSTTISGVDSQGTASAIISVVFPEARGSSAGIKINTDSLDITNSGQVNSTTLGEGDAGLININAKGDITLAGNDAEGNASLIVNKVSDSAGNSKGIIINANSLFLSDGATIDTSTSGQGSSGQININASHIVSLSGENKRGNFSAIFSTVQENATGNSGGIQLNTESLFINNGARIDASTFGMGNSGEINIVASNSIFLFGTSRLGNDSGIYSEVEDSAAGNSGDINILANSLLLNQGAVISTSIFGEGNSGLINIDASRLISLSGENFQGETSAIFSELKDAATGNLAGININTDILHLDDGSRISGTTSSNGDAGKITINASNNISLIGEDSQGNASAIFNQVSESAVGDSSGIEINTKTLSLKDGANITSNTSGIGDSGLIEINASNSISLEGESSQGVVSSIFNQVLPGAVGNSGDIEINTDTLSISNGAVIVSSTLGAGNSGEIRIEASDTISLSGESNIGNVSGIASEILSNIETGEFGVGNSGGIEIETGSLFLRDGTAITASTSGKGDSGSIRITANDTIALSGENRQGEARGIFSQVQPGAIGNSGGIEISTGELSLENGNAIRSDTSAKGNTGLIQITVGDKILLNGDSSTGAPSEITSQVFADADGTSKGIQITTDTIELSSGARISSSAFGIGEAPGGDISLQSGTLLLDNGKILTETDSGLGGDIFLNIGNLLQLQNNGRISSTAGQAQAGGDGGNITIRSPYILAFPSGNNDITANAFEGRGGTIQITTQGLFGLTVGDQLTPFNDITASSELGVDGTIAIANPEIDPSQGLTELPRVPTEPRIAQSCQSGGTSAGNSQFVNTGRGGLLPHPYEPLSDDSILADVYPPAPSKAAQATDKSVATTYILESKGWIIDHSGTITLVAERPASTTGCHFQSNTHKQALPPQALRFQQLNRANEWSGR